MEKIAVPLGVTWILGCFVAGFVLLNKAPATNVSNTKVHSKSRSIVKPAVPQAIDNVAKTTVKVDGTSEDMAKTIVEVEKR